jgi:hypothetical protein
VYLRQLKSNRPARLLLTNIGAVNRVTLGRNVIDAEGDEIAAAQFAVDGEIE